MCKKFISLLLSLTILLGAVWVPAGASAGTTPTDEVEFLFRDSHSPSSNFSKNLTATVGKLFLLLFEQAGTPTLTGYDFKGWYKSTDPSQAVIANDATVDGSAKQVILYAKWEPRTYSVTYNPNHSGDKSTIRQVTFGKKYGEKSDDFADPAPSDGYEFAGWFTLANGGKQITADTIVSDAKDHTLYAHWTRETISVTLDYAGGKYNNTDNATV